MSSKKKRRQRRDSEDARKQSKSEKRRKKRRDQADWAASTEAVLQQSELHKEKHFPAIIEDIFHERRVELPDNHPLLPVHREGVHFGCAYQLRNQFREGSVRRFAYRLCKQIAEKLPQLFGTPCHGTGWTYAHALMSIVKFEGKALRDPADWEPKTRSVHRSFDALLQFLFVKYPSHPSLRSYLLQPSPDPTLLGCFFSVSQGASLHKLELPIPLTKKMCHLFQQAPRKLSLIEAFRWAQLEALGGAKELFQAITHSFLGDTLMEDEEFWLTVLTWFTNHWDGPLRQVGPVLDYIRRQRHQDDTFSMKGRTSQALLRQMHAWHSELGKAVNIRWKPIPASGLAGYVSESSSGKSWKIQQIRDSVALFCEGREMRHCVYSYLYPAVEGRLSIWSMTYSQEHDPRPKRALTIEVRHASGLIVQVRGKSNRCARDEERAIIRQWAQQNKLTENYY